MQFKPLNFHPVRRIKGLVIGLCALAIALALMTTQVAASGLNITVYRDPACSWCGGWIDHLAAQGFTPKTVMTADMETLKQQQHVPHDLASCHTAVIQGYVIEGHVPVDDIKRLLAERPQIQGIAVPGMPIGTPGMESGDIHDAFSVIAFDSSGNTQVFHQYPSAAR